MYTRRAEWSDVWMDVATALARRSSCIRSRVGAVIVHDNYRVWPGFNGPPPGHLNCDRGGCPRGNKSFSELPSGSSFSSPQGFCTAVHAEMNAKKKFLDAGMTVDSKTFIYTTREPCAGCWTGLLDIGFLRPQVIWSR